MTIHYSDDLVILHAGDCLQVLRELADNTVDAVVTDPPYGLEFMGREWDSFRLDDPGTARNRGKRAADHKIDEEGRGKYGQRDQFRNPHGCAEATEWVTEVIVEDGAPPTMLAFGEWCRQWALECRRVLKPGGHLLSFGGTRTWHRLTTAVEDAGFEIRDSIAWLYASGFPKSLDVSKAIDKPATPDAQKWQGWGTALKPAFEPIVVARKPLAGTVAANVLAHGTGALNIDACRVGTDEALGRTNNGRERYNPSSYTVAPKGRTTFDTSDAAGGRWPPNVMLDGELATQVDEQSGTTVSRSALTPLPLGYAFAGPTYGEDKGVGELRPGGYDDEGGASRFFPVFHYERKAPTIERPHYWRPSCECEDAWPTQSPAKATDETTAPASSSTSKPGSDTTADYPTDSRFTTSTETSSTITPTISSPLTPPHTSESTPAASYEMASGGSPAASVANSSPSESSTGISAAKAGRSTGAADPAISLKWSATSVCGRCGRPARYEAHATVKPLELMRWLVRLVTPPGGLVLDPFAGSGTTAEACVIEGFRCVTIEREPTYLPLIVARLSKPIQPDLFAGIEDTRPPAVAPEGDQLGMFDLEPATEAPEEERWVVPAPEPPTWVDLLLGPDDDR